jgi:uncharacterized protein YcfJ
MMKTIFLSCLVSTAILSAQAQLFSPDSLNGAFLGSLIGGIAGSDCHHGFSGEGAAIGAGVGLLAGALAGEARRHDDCASPSYAYSTAPSVSFGYGYGNCGSSAYVCYTPNNYSAPGYYYRPTRPNYVVNGTMLGAASGALIGAGNHDAGQGAAIGAAAGLVLGSVAEATTQRRERRTANAIQSTPAPQAQPEVEPQAQPTEPAPLSQDPGLRTQDANAEIISKPCPTSTYHWTARPQIPDAPRVPDAPKF